MTHKKWAYLLFAILFMFAVNVSPIIAKPLTFLKQPQLSLQNMPDSNVKMMWSGIPNTWRYEIYRSKDTDSAYTRIAAVYAPSFTDTGVRPSCTYWYYVRAYNLKGNYVDSNHVKVQVSGIRQVLGFATYNNSGDDRSYNSLKNYSSLINGVATYTYTTDSLGNITGKPQSELIVYANNRGISTLALVTNNFDPDAAKNLLESPSNRQRLISNILSVLKANNYKGVNIDIEGIYYYDRQYFSTFIKELYTSLKPSGYMVTVDIPAKTQDNPTDGWSGGYDYREISRYADQIIIMTYDEHYSGGSPGPIASIGWVERVIRYSLTMIPRERILLGIAAYGYDWSTGKAKAYGMDQAVNIAAKYSSRIIWDDKSKSPYYKYTDDNGLSHTVWFENETSIGYKLDMVNKYKLSGIALWKLGLENKGYWDTVKLKLKQ